MRRSVPAVVGGGVAVAATVAAGGGTSRHDVVVLLGLAVAGAAAAAAVGAVVVHRLRHRPLRDQALAVALAALASTVFGVAVAAKAMFISSHDLRALTVVLVVSGAVAVGAALQLGDALGTGARHVGDLARRLGNGEDPPTPAVRPTGELAAAAAELVVVSRQLHESRQREQALDRSRRELIAWVSHDLRSPLATIRAMTEALDDGVVVDDDTVARYHHQIRRDAEKLSTLVDDLFELSRINSGTLQLTRRRAPLADVVADAVVGAEALARMKGVDVVVATGDLPEADVATHELARVLHNLLDNAIRHTPPGGRIIVESSNDGHHATLSIRDQCGGIPEPDLERVFDVAFRGDTARHRDHGGGGLGLAIARGLVEAHEGSIEVANAADGCRFTIHLPTP